MRRVGLKTARRRPGFWVAAILFSALPCSNTALAQGVRPRSFDIPAQALSDALLELSREADVDVIAPEPLTRGIRAPAVKGTMAAEHALSLLLSQSQLRFSRKTGGVFVIFARPVPRLDPSTRKAPTANPKPAVRPALQAEPAPQTIIVTAQRRSEGLQGVPISIAALTPENLRELNIRTTDQLQFATPGLVNTSTAGDGITTAYIRGVGTGYSGPGLESSVAVYLDDVYLQSQTESAQATLDIAQIQILKGPQGTLYGRNATGGAIVVTTADPRLDKADGYVKTGIGNLDWRRGETVINLPLSKTLAVRFAGYLESRDGYVRNIAVAAKRSGVGSGHSYTARGKLLWRPNDALETVVKVQFDRHDGNGAVHALRFTAGGQPAGLSYYETTQSRNREGGGGDDTNALALSARVEYREDDWALSNTLAYRRTRSFGCTDNDGLPEEVLYFCLVSQRSPDPSGAHGKEDETVINETRLVVDRDGPLDFTAGVFMERNRARFVGRIGGSLVGGLTPTFDNRDHLTAFSAFGEIYYRIAEHVKLTAGLRYTRESKAHSVRLDADMRTLRPDLPQSDSARTSLTNLTPRLVLTYEGERLVAYASYNRGFKSGGFNSPAPDIGPPLDSETIDAIELGARLWSDDGRTRASAALYGYDWKDVQVAFITGGGAGIMQQNAAGARVWGIELGIDHRAGPWRANLGLAYSHGRFTRFTNAAVYDVVGGRLQATAQDLRGYRLPQGPDLTATGSLSYRFDLPGEWAGSFTAAGRFSSKYDFTAGGGGELRANRQPAFALFNLSGTFNSPDDSLELGWFAANLFKQRYVSLISTGDTGVYMTPAEPRTYGITLRRSF